MRHIPTTALYATAAEAAISQLSPPPMPDVSDDIPASATDAADSIDDVVTPSAATILIIIASMVVSLVALHAAIRCFINADAEENSRRSWAERAKAAEAEMRAVVASVTTTVAHKGGGGDGEASSSSAAAAVECAICLAEFEEGEEKKVLGSCGHGFHGRCIERWFAASRNSSCPTCRQACLPPTLPPVVASSGIATGGGG